MWLPSGLKRTWSTWLSCPSSLRRIVPSAMVQTIDGIAALAVDEFEPPPASHVPSGLKATELTLLPWPSSVRQQNRRKATRALVSHPQEPVASTVPSGLKAAYADAFEVWLPCPSNLPNDISLLPPISQMSIPFDTAATDHPPG